jgi:hypothetical protein
MLLKYDFFLEYFSLWRIFSDIQRNMFSCYLSGIATGYGLDDRGFESRHRLGIFLFGLDDRGSRVRFPARTGNLSLHHRVQNSSGAHPASYPMGIRGSFPGGEAAGA